MKCKIDARSALRQLKQPSVQVCKQIVCVLLTNAEFCEYLLSFMSIFQVTTVDQPLEKVNLDSDNDGGAQLTNKKQDNG